MISDQVILIIVIIIGAWIIFSALLVTIICVNSARLSRIDEPFKDPAYIDWVRKGNQKRKG